MERAKDIFCAMQAWNLRFRSPLPLTTRTHQCQTVIPSDHTHDVVARRKRKLNFSNFRFGVSAVAV
jgi:hypothetical protein